MLNSRLLGIALALTVSVAAPASLEARDGLVFLAPTATTSTWQEATRKVRAPVVASRTKAATASSSKPPTYRLRPSELNTAPSEPAIPSTHPDRRGALLAALKGGTKDRLRWRWRHGADTPAAEPGDPFLTTDYALCVYDQPGRAPRLLVAASTPPGGTCADKPCWRRSSRNNLRYRDPERTPEGLDQLRLNPGADGKAQLAVRGRGANLRLPPLGLSLPVTVQLQSTDGRTPRCWESVFDTDVHRNDADAFMAHGS